MCVCLFVYVCPGLEFSQGLCATYLRDWVLRCWESQNMDHTPPWEGGGEGGRERDERFSLRCKAWWIERWRREKKHTRREGGSIGDGPWGFSTCHTHKNSMPLHACVCVWVCEWVCVWIRFIKHHVLMLSHFHAFAKQPNVTNCCVSSVQTTDTMSFCSLYS